jgi:hypothetical protein
MMEPTPQATAAMKPISRASSIGFFGGCGAMGASDYKNSPEVKQILEMLSMDDLHYPDWAIMLISGW